MNSRQFLEMIWPDAGNYCIATPTTNIQTGKKGYKHTVHGALVDAYHDARANYKSKDIYFGIFTHIHANVLRPQQGRSWPSRKRENMDSARTLFLDLDVGASTWTNLKYATQADGLAALARFVFRTGLPQPYVVSSGNGLHVYWPLSTPLTADEWRPLAASLRLLLDADQMIYDPSRTVDTTSVLRVPSTLNHKDPDNPKPVTILFEGEVSDTHHLTATLILLTAGMQPLKVVSSLPAPAQSMGGVIASNISPHGVGFAPTDADDVAVECEQIRMFRDSKGNISEPHWYAALGVVGFCTNGAATAQAWSSGHPTYSASETQAKLDQWQARASVPSCSKFATDGAVGVCQKCPHFSGQFKNPIVITNKKPVVAAQQAALMAAQPTAKALAVPMCPPPVCDPPYPYNRIQSLGVNYTNSKGVVCNVIEEIDLYPISLSSGRAENGNKVNGGVSTWVARERDSKGSIRHEIIEIPNNMLSEPVKLGQTFAVDNVFFPITPEVPRYMSAYLKKLKAEAGATKQYAHLGWPDRNKYDRFILNKKVIKADGTVEPCVMAPMTDIATIAFNKGGTLPGQLEALRFYDHPTYSAQQFFILCSLATPLFIATDHHGAVVNMSGESGASKSTSLKAAAGIWADPSVFMVNGTSRGMSPMARDQRAACMPNLPTMIDEITLMDPEEARTMVMSAPQPGTRTTLDGDRRVREARVGGWKSMLLLTTANISLHQLVNSHGAAGTANTARIIELIAERSAMIHTTVQANAANAEFSANFGWLGEHFMQLAMPCIDFLMESVKRMMDKLNCDLQGQSVERFYLAVAAPVFVAGTFAAYHGLIDWNMDALYDWFVKTQMPSMRQTLRSETDRLSYANLMRDFLGANTLNTISDDGKGNIPPAMIRTEVVVHHRTDLNELWVHKGVLREFCDKRGVSYATLLRDLTKSGVITDPDARKPLGFGTRYGVTRPHVAILNAKHPDIA